MDNLKININGIEFELGRLRLKGWTYLDSLRKTMESAVSKKSYKSYYDAVIKFIDTALVPSKNTVDWSTVSWFELLDAFYVVVRLNTPTLKLPILESSLKENDPLPWEYDGRTWYFWFHLFAKSYGWTENVIANLDIDDAIALYQEIVIEEQLQREWEWGMSEVSYEYNKATKTSKHRSLERPKWMLPIVPEPKKIKIRKDMLPVGNTINPNEDELKRRAQRSGI